MPRYTAAQFIAAIPGTGGVISALADVVGCDWHTAKKFIERYATVAEAWEAECSRVNDKARHNIVEAIFEGDLSMSKWWLQIKDSEFIPTQRLEHDVDGRLEIVYINDWRSTTDEE